MPKEVDELLTMTPEHAAALIRDFDKLVRHEHKELLDQGVRGTILAGSHPALDLILDWIMREAKGYDKALAEHAFDEWQRQGCQRSLLYYVQGAAMTTTRSALLLAFRLGQYRGRFYNPYRSLLEEEGSDGRDSDGV